MPLAAGMRIGPYEIQALAGAGGMGEVYRARDTKLNRDVAIKILPDLFATDPDRLARFTREAQTLAALSHTNIAHIYGVIDQALVMEFAEGEDLSWVIAHGPLPLPEALMIARQIADALEAAHEQGIVHRDLKPANVKVGPHGLVKVLDFGLAKAMGPDAVFASGSALDSPTFTAHVTQKGVILGTAAYMAPEQVRGKSIDKRADIWAFGVVLFEMLAGRRPFDDEEITGVLARVLERDPEWTLLPATLPQPLRTLLERCLAKDPRMRLRDIGDARYLLEQALPGRSGSQSVSGAATRARGVWLPWAIAGALAVVAAGAWLRGPATAPSIRPIRVELTLPENVEFYDAPRITLDGHRIAFIGVHEGIRAVYVRALDEAVARPIAGTEGCIFFTFSPDGQSIAAIAVDSNLRRIALDSGTIEKLASGAGGGVAWTSQGTVVFGSTLKIMAVPAAGGAVREIVSAAPGETAITNPVATPDGRTVLFTVSTGAPDAPRSRIEAVPTNGGARRVVIDDGAYVLAAMHDRLLFQRDGSIYSASFDPASAQISGSVTKLTDEARLGPSGDVAAAVTAAGDLLFADTHSFNARLAWVSVDSGTERAVTVPARAYYNPRVSPDGRRVAYSDATTIWTTDTERGAQVRVYVGRDAQTGFPIWSNDGSFLFFKTATGIMRMRADGEGQPEPIPGSVRSDYPSALSADGTTLLITHIAGTTGGDVALLPIMGGGPKLIVATPAFEGGGQFSPDGKWITYVSNVSGRMEVYLRSLNGAERYPVSTSGGIGAIWSPDGKRIYFRNGLQFLAVDVSTIPTVTLSQPKPLFERAYSFGPNITFANYTLSHDGRDFLVVNSITGHLSLIFNWLHEQASLR